MPEQIVWTARPLVEAINKVTKNYGYQWRFCSLTRNDKEYWNGQHVMTGVRIEVFHPKHGWRKATIRDDYDFAGGQPPAGKGYHVNVELPGEKIAYCLDSGTLGEAYVKNLWAYNTERLSVDGEVDAAKWYMRAKNPDPSVQTNYC